MDSNPAQLAELPPSRLAVYTQIDVAQSLMKIGKEGAGKVQQAGGDLNLYSPLLDCWRMPSSKREV
jgi:hypothetical protein